MDKDNTYLSAIDTHIRQRGIPFDKFSVKLTSLPSFLVNVAREELFKSDNISQLDDDVYFLYDNSGNLTMEFTGRGGKNILYVSDRREDKGIDVAGPGTKCYFDSLLTKALNKEYFANEEYKVKAAIEERFPGESKKAKYDLFVDIMKIFSVKHSRELMEENKSILDDPRTLMELFGNAQTIKEYIDYLNALYVESLSVEEVETVCIDYTPSADEAEDIKVPPLYPTDAIERKNDVIAVDKRLKLLKGHNPIYQLEGRSTKTGLVDQLCYLYQIDDFGYYIIIEPYNGQSYTRLIAVSSEYNINLEAFASLAKEYLEYSSKEIINRENTARLYHTSEEKFVTDIGYALTRDGRKYKLNTYTKTNIDTMVFKPIDNLLLK